MMWSPNAFLDQIQFFGLLMLHIFLAALVMYHEWPLPFFFIGAAFPSLKAHTKNVKILKEI